MTQDTTPPRPVEAWCAVSPDGKLMRHTVRASPEMALDVADHRLVFKRIEDMLAAGWRVIRVRVVPQEAGDE